MHPIKQALLEKITSGLARKSVSRCSDWALRYRRLGVPFPGPWTFKHHPWLRDMMNSDAEMNIGQKAAQLGYTEAVLNRTLFNIDIRAMDCLYILPSWKPDASDFSSGRFNPAIELSPHLSNIFSDVSNVGHKRAGYANLYIRGSRSRSQLKSIPVAQIVIDEKDEMDQDNVPLAFERLSGQLHREVWQISTPTFPEYGINADYLRTSENHYFFKCPSCSRSTELVFPDCLVITAEKLTDSTLKESHLICKECRSILPHQTKSEWLENSFWVETYTNRDWKGWHISQLYSPTVEPWKIAETAIKAQLDPAEETELYNSKIGVPHTVKGAGVTDAQIQSCIFDYRMMLSGYTGNRLVTMGIDVGYPTLHVEIDEWLVPPAGTPIVDINIVSVPRVIWMGEIPNFDEADKLMSFYRVNFCIVDSQPERRLALEFANRWYRRVRCCSYEQGIEGKQIHLDSNEPRLKVDRTSWLDLSLGRFKVVDTNGKPSIYLPSDTLPMYRRHIKAQIRIYQKDRNGNQTGKYLTPVGEDHYGHARNYAEIALPLAATMNHVIDITSPVM